MQWRCSGILSGLLRRWSGIRFPESVSWMLNKRAHPVAKLKLSPSINPKEVRLGHLPMQPFQSSNLVRFSKE